MPASRCAATPTSRSSTSPTPSSSTARPTRRTSRPSPSRGRKSLPSCALDARLRRGYRPSGGAAVENLPSKTFDVLSFTGLIALIPFLLEGFKKLHPVVLNGREPWVCMVLCYLIGVPVKYFTPTDYNGWKGPMGWIVTVIGLFLCGVGAMAVHDN